MVKVYIGWFIKISRKGLFSKQWKLTFYDGLRGAIMQYPSKDNAKIAAQHLIEEVCKDYLERVKQSQSDLYNKILSDSNFLWRTERMGYIPIGKIAQKIISNETGK